MSGYVLFEPFSGVDKIVLTTKISEEIKPKADEDLTN